MAPWAGPFYFDIVIPGALPTIFTGLRISLQACWMVLVAAELVGSFAGLGHIMIIATRDLNPGMIVVAMAGVAYSGSCSPRFVLPRAAGDPVAAMTTILRDDETVIER